MYLLILYIPLLSAIIPLLTGRWIGEQGTKIYTTTSIGLTSLLSWFLMISSFKGATGTNGTNNVTNGTTNSNEQLEKVEEVYLSLFTWFSNNEMSVIWGLQFDRVTMVMLIVVTTISTLVHMYSISYMNGDAHTVRFMSYLSLFTFFMLILVTADNLVQLFIGWEGVGTCSYLLINFWFTRIQANKSAIKAMVVNRVGDLALALGMFGLIYSIKSVQISTILANIHTITSYKIVILGFNLPLITIIGILLFIGAVGKSAQLLLHTWLPDAMEGPTPVSALIHAATMVTAGVYLIIRFSPLYEQDATSLKIITIMGALTAIFAATIGIVQNDIKRVIAYSTCSQLGYMVFAAGLSNYSVSLFHLTNHAFFKALLFLSAGSVIHALANEQDMRKLGGLIQKIPATYSLMLIASLALTGFPYLTGYYSKDVLLELSYGNYSVQATFSHWLGTIAAFCTAYYSFRLTYFVFYSKPLNTKENFNAAHEGDIFLLIPLYVLGIASIFFGYITKDLYVGLGSDTFNQSIYVLPINSNSYSAEFISYFIKLIPVIFSILGSATALFLLINKPLFIYNLKITNSTFFKFLVNKWYFDKIYNEFLVKPSFLFGHQITYKLLDRGLFEMLGPNGLTVLITNFTRFTSSLQSGLIYHYAFIMLIATSIFMLISQI